MTAAVRIEASEWGELRYVTLARLMGLADADHALIKAARIRAWQTEHYTPEAPTYVVDPDIVESALGAGGAAALVRARLAAEHPDGLHILDSEGRVEWLWQRRQASAKGGEATARKARAGSKPAPAPQVSRSASFGDPRDNDRPAGPGHSQPEPGPVPGPKPSPLTLLPEEEDLSLSSAIPPSLSPAQQPATPAPDVLAMSPPAPVREDLARTQPTATPATRSPAPKLDKIVQPAPGEPSLDQLWTELEQARMRAAAARGVAIQLLVAHDVGRHDLAELLAEASRVGKRGELVAQIRHAIAAAEAESRVAPEPGKPDRLQWFTGAIFAPRNFRRLVAAPLPKRAGPLSAASAHDPAPPPKEVPAGERAGPEQFREARALLAHLTSNDDETPNPKPRKAKTA